MIKKKHRKPEGLTQILGDTSKKEIKTDKEKKKHRRPTGLLMFKDGTKLY